MTAIELLFAPVLVVAAPLTIGRLEFGDSLADRWLDRVRIVAPPLALAAMAGLFLAPGPVAGALAAPWQVATVLLATAGLARFIRDPRRHLRGVGVTTSVAFLAFGATNAMSYAIGLAPLGFAPTIVLLTAVHFHAAGFVLMVAGILAYDRRPSRASAVGVAGVAVGSMITAAGFVGAPGAAVTGAVVVAIGGLLIGFATIRVAPTLARRAANLLATLAGAALFVSMPLAIVWAVGTQLGSSPIDLDLMIRTHGAINALVVAVPVAVAWTLDGRSAAR